MTTATKEVPTWPKKREATRILSADNKDDVIFWVEPSQDYLDLGIGYGKRTLAAGTKLQGVRDHAPQWFIERMRTFKPDAFGWSDRESNDSRTAVHIFRDECHHWDDHCGWSGEGEDSHFVAEPYHLTHEDAKNLEEVCKNFKLSYLITGMSSHYPSRTFRISIKPITLGADGGEDWGWR